MARADTGDAIKALPAVLPPDLTLNRQHDDRIKAARAWAQWHLGDPSWADAILSVYQRPQGYIANLLSEANG